MEGGWELAMKARNTIAVQRGGYSPFRNGEEYSPSGEGADTVRTANRTKSKKNESKKRREAIKQSEGETIRPTPGTFLYEGKGKTVRARHSLL